MKRVKHHLAIIQNTKCIVVVRFTFKLSVNSNNNNNNNKKNHIIQIGILHRIHWHKITTFQLTFFSSRFFISFLFLIFSVFQFVLFCHFSIYRYCCIIYHCVFCVCICVQKLFRFLFTLTFFHSLLPPRTILQHFLCVFKIFHTT